MDKPPLNLRLRPVQQSVHVSVQLRSGITGEWHTLGSLHMKRHAYLEFARTLTSGYTVTTTGRSQ